MFGCGVLGGESEGAGGDVQGGGGEGAEIHQNGGGARVGDHNVAFQLGVSKRSVT